MVNFPAGPAVLPTSLVVLMNTRRAPTIGVSSAFTFTRNVLALSAISPAGAGPIVVATMVAPPAPCSSGNAVLVKRIESAVIVMGEGIVFAVPPKILLLTEISSSVTLVAAVPGPPTPWIVILPVAPPDASVLHYRWQSGCHSGFHHQEGD